MAKEPIPVVLLAENVDQYGWQIVGLSNPFNTTYYVKAAIFDRAFTNGQTTTPVGIISEKAATQTNPYNSTPIESVTGLTAGNTYTVYGGLLTPSGQWWTTTPESASVTLSEVYTNPIEFETVTWQKPQNPANKPWGQNWVEDIAARDKWGRLDVNGNRAHLWGFYRSSTTDRNQLIHETWDALQKNLNPLVRYTINIIDLNRILGQNLDPLYVGDTVTIVDNDLGVRIQSRILERNIDLNYPEKSNIVLGQVTQSVTNTLASNEFISGGGVGGTPVYDEGGKPATGRRGELDSYLANLLKRGDPLPADWLEGKIDALRNEINAGKGTVKITDDHGILITDPSRAGYAIKLEGGMLAISNSLTPAGDYNWRSFGTGDGFTADEINGGTITGLSIIGNYISGGTMEATNINGGDINGAALYGTYIEGGKIVGTDIRATNNLYVGDPNDDTDKTIYFSNSASIRGTGVSLPIITFSTWRLDLMGIDVLNIGDNDGAPSTVYARGNWNFSEANVTGIAGATAKFG